MTTKKKSDTLKFLEELAGRPLTLGGLLESIRLSEELSQAAFAKKLGMDVIAAAFELDDLQVECGRQRR